MPNATIDKRPKRKNMNVLTGIRGFAAIWIVFHHIRGFLGRNYGDYEFLLERVVAGHIAVDLFAFLSGFVIALSYTQALSDYSFSAIKRYFWYRFVRIYPLLVFVLVLFAAWYLYSGQAASVSALPATDTLIRQLLMVNSLGLETTWLWNVPSWTVSVEWLCYLLFPIFAPFLFRLENGVLALVLAALVFALTVMVMFAIDKPNFLASPKDLGGIKMVGEFYVGALLFQVVRLTDWQHVAWHWVALLSFVFSMYICVDYPVIAVACYPLLILSFSQIEDKGIMGFLFGNRVIVYLGEISYSIYLVHWLIVTIWGTVPYLANQPAPIRLGGTLLSLFLLSLLCHYLVEKTSRRYLRGLVK